MLEQRWRTRGEAALAAHQPGAALNDLHSALAYAPDDRGIEVELATALADAGRLQESQVYFTTLLEAEPGSGLINLQMARLAIKQGNAQSAIDHYQSAIDGTWNGDAFAKRREIRLELARFLIAQRRFAEARNLLLITSGNGPDNFPLQLKLGGLLEQAEDPADALDVYRKAALHHATRLEALEGEAHAAAALGRFAEARSYLAEAAGEGAFARQPAAARDTVRTELETADEVLALYPSLAQPSAERARRIAHAAALARSRLLACTQAPAPDTELDPGAPENRGVGQTASASKAAPKIGSQAFSQARAIAERLQQLNPLASRPAPSAVQPQSGSAAPADTLASLSARWAPIPSGTALLKQLTADPAFAQNTLELVYETERQAAGICGPPTGDDALLLRIADAPDQVEAHP